jgi:hypothetical protein
MINNYLFTYNDEDKAIQYGFKVDDDTNHYYVVREFVQFLSSIYGYDLTEKYLGNSPSDT